MRRLKSQHGKERGAAGVLVAVMMLVLIGAGAMAVDVGQIYAERAQLQNAADAGAMAAAKQCHEAGGCSVLQATTWAAELSGPNSNDGASTIAEVDLSVPNQVTVATSTRNGSSGAGFLTQDVRQRTQCPARDGRRPRYGFDRPSFERVRISARDFGQLLRPLEQRVPPERFSRSRTSQAEPAPARPGTQIPGGWGWLDQNEPCEAETQTGSNSIGSDPGNNPPTECQTILAEWKATISAGGEVDATFPIFDDATNQGQNGSFHIIGYATFKIWGWKFGNNARIRIPEQGQRPRDECRTGLPWWKRPMRDRPVRQI